MDLLLDLKQQRQMATLLISHDLGVVAGNAENIAVMYAGQIVESGPVATIFAEPLHPYTQGLLNCVHAGPQAKPARYQRAGSRPEKTARRLFVYRTLPMPLHALWGRGAAVAGNQTGSPGQMLEVLSSCPYLKSKTCAKASPSPTRWAEQKVSWWPLTISLLN